MVVFLAGALAPPWTALLADLFPVRSCLQVVKEMHKYAVRRLARTVESCTKMATARRPSRVEGRGLRLSRGRHRHNSMLSFSTGDSNRLFDSKPFRLR